MTAAASTLSFGATSRSKARASMYHVIVHWRPQRLHWSVTDRSDER